MKPANLAVSALFISLALFCGSANSRLPHHSPRTSSDRRETDPDSPSPIRQQESRFRLDSIVSELIEDKEPSQYYPENESEKKIAPFRLSYDITPAIVAVEKSETLKPEFEDLKFSLNKEMTNQKVKTMVEQADTATDFISIFIPAQDPATTWNELVDEYIGEKAMANNADKKEEISIFMKEMAKMNTMSMENNCPNPQWAEVIKNTRRKRRADRDLHDPHMREIMDNIHTKAQCGKPTSILIDVYQELGLTRGLANNYVYPSCMMVPRCRSFSGCCQDGNVCVGTGESEKILFIISKINPITMNGELTIEEKDINVDRNCHCQPLRIPNLKEEASGSTTFQEENSDTPLAH